MPSKRSTRKPKSLRKVVAVETVVTEPVVIEPVKDIITEQTETTTEPEVEIRRPATLAQALTQPPVAVVKPKTKVRRRIVERKRIA
jgi:hypothetical protein